MTRYYAFRVRGDGTKQRLKPFGAKTFGAARLAWLKRRAKRKDWKLVVKKVRASWRERMLEAMTWGLIHEPGFHYAQIRPFDPDAIAHHALPITTDCSGSTTMLYRAASRPDPNGNDYDGTGYTGTLRSHTPMKLLADLETGDFAVYGTGAGSHVAVVHTPHPTDPLMWSHGQEAGPILVKNSVELKVHGGYATYHGQA